MNADHADTIRDAALMPPSMLAKIIATYRELSEANHALGLHDEAIYCDLHADALQSGGVIDWGDLT